MSRFTFELLNMVVDEITYKSPDEEINEYLIFKLEDIREKLKYFLFDKTQEVILSSEKVSSELVSYYFKNFYDWDDEEVKFQVLEKLMDLELQGKNLRFNDETKNSLFLIDKYVENIDDYIPLIDYIDFSFYQDTLKKYIDRLFYFIEHIEIDKEETTKYIKRIEDIKEKLTKSLVEKAIHIIDYDSCGFFVCDFRDWADKIEKISPNLPEVLELKGIVENLELEELEEENDYENDEIDENYRPIYCVAEDIIKDWGDKINYAAQPYLYAMLETEANQEEYGYDSLDEIISYFLANSLTYHTEKSREYKKELRNFLKILRLKRNNK